MGTKEITMMLKAKTPDLERLKDRLISCANSRDALIAILSNDIESVEAISVEERKSSMPTKEQRDEREAFAKSMMRIAENSMIGASTGNPLHASDGRPVKF